MAWGTCGAEGVRRLLMFGATSGPSLHIWSCLFVLAPDLGWVSSLTAMPPFFAVRLHRGGIFVGREVSSAAAVA